MKILLVYQLAMSINEATCLLFHATTFESVSSPPSPAMGK